MRSAISARIGIGLAVAIVVQIVELADAGEARLQHLDIELRRDRLDMRPASCVSAKRYITSRQLQKLSAEGPRRSASPAMPRWKAWLCRFGMAGQQHGVALVAGLRRRRRSRRCAIAAVRRASGGHCVRQPSGSRALFA